jgi:hypothetical protein
MQVAPAAFDQLPPEGQAKDQEDERLQIASAANQDLLIQFAPQPAKMIGGRCHRSFLG